ncbi:DUF7564 family protein [Halobellus clavatus]|jgi:hypothetical protein|uniref:Small CPxCG-related zinc finger protein n=1 Tax=Halobellus clavatus TaxID=660517 RepID=A0A1H3DCG7_9EURY|nr:hypothetical protein [Halobellus clavatus]SDX63369.1 hypothetical protein SAMN04487946_101453 [Halobellus clavatus]
MTRSHVTCLDCGTEFVRPTGYQGNYCPECHEAWAAEADGREDAGPRRLGGRTKPSVRHRDDAEADAPPRYDERDE